MKRRPLRAAGSFGLYAMCICLSTIALQALTSPSPAPAGSFLSRLNPVDAFIWTQTDPPQLSAKDLKLRNLSVHRVRYVNEAAGDVEDTEAPVPGWFTAARTSRPAEVSSVVVTWEDHPLAAHARAQDAKLEEGEEEEAEEMMDAFSYEVQIWVTGWGLDGLWNPANRRVATRDPFVVLVDLPREQELAFRVRMKARQTKRSLLGFLLPTGFFSTETDGKWSDVVTLSPTTDDELEAIVTFLTGNKPLLLLLALCIGSSCLVVAQLYVRRRLARSRQRKLLKLQLSRRSSSEKDETERQDDDDTGSSGKDAQELAHEIRDRQELADCEDEVRQLMLFSGYGIEALAPHELEQLERELKHTLLRIQHLKKHGAATPEKPGRSGSVDEQGRRERRRLKQRDALPMSPIYEHRSF